MHLSSKKIRITLIINQIIFALLLLVFTNSGAFAIPPETKKILLQRAELATECGALTLNRLHEMAFRAAATTAYMTAEGLNEAEASYIAGFKTGAASMKYSYMAGQARINLVDFLGEQLTILNCNESFSTSIKAIEDLESRSRGEKQKSNN